MDFSQITRRAFIWSVAKYTSWLLALVLSHSLTHSPPLLGHKCSFFLSILSFPHRLTEKTIWIITSAVSSHSLAGAHCRERRNHHLFESKHTNIHERERERDGYTSYMGHTISLFIFLPRTWLRASQKETKRSTSLNLWQKSMRHIFRSYCRQHIKK